MYTVKANSNSLDAENEIESFTTRAVTEYRLHYSEQPY